MYNHIHTYCANYTRSPGTSGGGVTVGVGGGGGGVPMMRDSSPRKMCTIDHMSGVD